MERVQQYFAIAREREAIRRRRAAGALAPWTDDPIFRDWRFTNVSREHDATTIWFREHVRSKLEGWPVIEATIVFRFFNRIETGEVIKDLLLDGWNRDEAYARLSKIDGPLWTGAYRIRGENGRPKLASTLDSIDTARRQLQRWAPRWGRSLRDAHRELSDVPFMGSFMAYEVVSDLRWTPVLANATDILTWAAAGPGCAAGLGWLLSGNVKRFNYQKPLDQVAMLDAMRRLLGQSRDPANWPHEDAPWEMREVEHWACETRKYVRLRDEGQPPRERFRPRTTVLAA